MKRIIPIALFAIAIATAACGKSDKDKDKGKKGKTPAADKDKGPADKGKTPPVAAKKDLPPAPADAMEGKGRIINVFVDADGKSKKVDVWARRSFKYGPSQLAKDVELGKASDWFDVAKGQSVVIVDSGAGADGEKIGSIFGPKKGEHITGIFTGKSTGVHWETAATKRSGVAEAPPAGKGLVIVRAGQLRSLDGFKKNLTEAKLDNAFLVGDSKGSCHKQRAEESGGQPVILGGTNSTEYLFAPGKVTMTLHGWMERDKCGATAMHTIEVDVKADTATLVLVYTPDAGKTLASAQIPMAVAAAAPAAPAK
jgi:hypothetical protein